MLKAIFALLILMPVFALAYSSPVTHAYARYWASPGKPSGLVNDFVEVLSTEQKTALEEKLVSFEKETGHEISVAVIKNLGGDTIENYAEELFKEWGIGKKNADNGVLLLAAMEDREMRIEVGYGLEGALTDAETKWILDDTIAPFFKEGKYFEGIGAGVDKIAEAVKGEVVSGSAKKSSKIPFDTFIVIGWFLFIALASILGKSKSWWAGGIVGGIIGVIVGIIKGFVFLGAIALAVFIPFGLLFDYFISKSYQKSKLNGGVGPWWLGGGKGGGFGGGFGGFGGGGSGGGGSSSKW